jgi:hypothetical protein
MRFLAAEHRYATRLDAVDEISLFKKISSTAGCVYAPLRRSACKCPQSNPSRPVCLDKACVTFRAVWMAKWQVEFFKRPHAFATFFLDGTGQVNEYGYPLVTVMIVNPATMRGIPIAHLIAGRVSAADLEFLLAFVYQQRQNWHPRL